MMELNADHTHLVEEYAGEIQRLRAKKEQIVSDVAAN
jgi:hypothetical protein